MTKNTNPWITFLKDQRGGGKSITELRDMYVEKTTNAPPVYQYDNNADIKKDSMIESLKEDERVFPQGIGYINNKIEMKHLDDISEEEEESWRLAFEMALTDDYILTKKDLLTSHDWWINRLIQESDLDGDDVNDIINDVQKNKHDDIYQFLDHLLPMFTLEQLYSIGYPDMK